MYVLSSLYLDLFCKFSQLIIPATLGLVAYPGQGIYKSIYASTHSGTSKKIAIARREEGSYLLPKHETDMRQLLEAWEKFGGRYVGT